MIDMSQLALSLITDRTKVFQSNSLVNARYRMTAAEHRILLMTFSQIQKSDTHFKPYLILLSDYKKLSRTKRNISNNELKKIAEGLLDKQYEKQTSDGGWIKGNFVSNVQYKPSKKGIYVQLDNKLEEDFLNLQENYTSYFLKYAGLPESIHSQRIYQLLNENKWRKKVDMDVEDLRKMLSLGNKYPSYGDFKKYVLLQAKKDLDKDCDLTFKEPFIEKKNGRSVVAIELEIEINHAVINKNDDEIEENIPLVKELIQCGLSSKRINEIMALKDEVEIRQKLDAVIFRHKQGQIKSNLGGYLWTVLNSDSPVASMSERELKAEDKKQSKIDAYTAKKDAEKREQIKVEALKNDFNVLYDKDLLLFRSTFENNLESTHWKEFENYVKEMPECQFWGKSLLKDGVINAESEYYELAINSFYSSKFGNYSTRFMNWAFEMYGYYITECNRYSSGYKIETKQGMLL